MSVHPGLYEDNEPSGYDYENDHDTSEYCPNVALVSTVKSVIEPLCLLAAPYTFSMMKWLILMLLFYKVPSSGLGWEMYYFLFDLLWFICVCPGSAGLAF